ncbi:MAG TPA: LapA family protein, partial [Chloroflexota bacterium]|nr:LapA family protein [Chloroflexota bacterium]
HLTCCVCPADLDWCGEQACAGAIIGLCASGASQWQLRRTIRSMTQRLHQYAGEVTPQKTEVRGDT